MHKRKGGKERLSMTIQYLRGGFFGGGGKGPKEILEAVAGRYSKEKKRGLDWVPVVKKISFRTEKKEGGLGKTS